MTTTVYTPDQIKSMFRACTDQAQLDHRLTALVAQYAHEPKLVQQFKSIAGQIKPSLPEKAVKERRNESGAIEQGPKMRTLKATRPADLDPQVWAQWLTLEVKVAQGNLSRWRTLLVQHDATGLDKSVHGEYRKGSDGNEYFYPAIKVAAPAAGRTKITPAAEVATYRAAQDKSGIELSSGAYDLLSRAERKVYAAAHLARLEAKKVARKAQAQQSKAEDQVTKGQAAFVAATAPVAPAPVVEVKRGSLTFK